MMRLPSFNLDFPPLFQPIRSMAARRILGRMVETPDPSRIGSPASGVVPSYQRRLLASLWEEGRRQANPIPGMIVLLLVNLMVLIVSPSAWPPLVYLPLIVSLWSVWLGATMGRRWGGRLTGAGTEAQSFLAPATRTLRYRAWSWQGLAWAQALWILSVLPAFWGTMLQRFEAVTKGPLPAFPWVGALVYPAALTLAFLLSFRGFMTATSAGGYRRAFWATAGLAALLVLLLEGLPRSLAMQPLDSPLWRLGLPFSGPPASWWSALSVSLLLALAGRVHRGGLRAYDLKDAVGRPLTDGGGPGWAAGRPVADGGGLVRASRIAPNSLGSSIRVWLLVFVVCMAVMPAILDLGRRLGAASVPAGTDGTLAITRQAGGAFNGASLIQGDLAYLGMTNGIGVMDISDPRRPRMVGWTEPGYQVSALTPYGGGLVYARVKSLMPLDIRVPSRPRIVSHWDKEDLVLSGLQTDQGHRYGYGTVEFPDRVYRLDDRYPLALRAAQTEEIGTEIMGLVADGAGRLVVAIKPQETSSREMVTIDLADDGTMSNASLPVELPEQGQLLAARDGLIYLLVGDDSLHVYRLGLTGPKPQISDPIATLSLRRAPAKGDPLRGDFHGEIRGDQLLFVRPKSKVMTLVDIAEPDRPIMVAEQGQYPWTTGFDWSASGIISAFSTESPSELFADRIVTWHLLRLSSSGAFEALSQLSRPSYLLLAKTDAGVWVKARNQAAQRIDTLGKVAPVVPDAKPPIEGSFDPLIASSHDDGSSMWIRGNRQFIANRVALGLRDVGGGATQWLGIGGEVRGGAFPVRDWERDWSFPQIQAASDTQLVVSHERGVAVVDISEPEREKVSLDWQDHAEWTPGLGDDSRCWAGVYGDWLLALSRDVVLYRWRLDRLDLPPERLEIPMPRPDADEDMETTYDYLGRKLSSKPSRKPSNPPATGSDRRSLTRAFHVGGRLFVVERYRPGDLGPQETSLGRAFKMTTRGEWRPA